ncbi:hypothetical protein NPX13_g9878 [Xylaria arbuscula]|uniref:Uncharacterized protein n=1 Tax=Xylaria arbuscula TaxID=114810 RepID=A0A9W8N5U4_9PEZI|nr:hypothetical protein NPX13_g9878 [Xylaria arbuscula]
MMLLQLVTSGLLAAVSLFAPSVEAKKMTAVRFVTRADDYLWTVQWTGPTKCTSWPCGYSYRVTGPTYTAAEGSIPFFNATCVGTVDKPLQACTLQPGSAAAAVSGNFSTYETSGVGSGLIDVTATWIDMTS